MIKAPPFPKRARPAAADTLAEVDALLPADPRPWPDFVLSQSYARALARSVAHRYNRQDRTPEARERECFACAQYNQRLVDNGTISAETARIWTESTVRFNTELTLIFKEEQCQKNEKSARSSA
jgi:hypothetical protein